MFSFEFAVTVILVVGFLILIFNLSGQVEAAKEAERERQEKIQREINRDERDSVRQKVNALNALLQENRNSMKVLSSLSKTDDLVRKEILSLLKKNEEIMSQVLALSLPALPAETASIPSATPETAKKTFSFDLSVKEDVGSVSSSKKE